MMTNNTANHSYRRALSALLATSALLAFGACKVTQTEKGELPDVDVAAEAGELPEYEIVKTNDGELPNIDVDVDGGKLPAYDVDLPDVDVGVRKETVLVPKVRVVLEEEEITVPYLDIDLPGDDANTVKVERPIAVRLAVPNAGYDVRITDIHVVDGALWVISELSYSGDKPGGPLTVSDTVVVNTTEMDVKHYVVGMPVRTADNDQFEFIPNRTELADELRSGKTIYRS